MPNVHTVIEGETLTITVHMADVVKELNRTVEYWQQTAERLRTQWGESEWYLGEARASIGRLEEQLHALGEAHAQLEAGHREVAAGLRECQRQRDEANRYLEELRPAHEDLRRQHQQLTAQFARATDDIEGMRRLAEQWQDDLDVARAGRQAAEKELQAVRDHGERRGRVRTYRPDMVAEIRSPEGGLLFHGCPQNVSVTGLAFAVDQPFDEAPDFVEITLHIPGVGRPLEAIGRLAWREAVEGSHQNGCELLDMLPNGRKSLEQVLASAA